MIDFTRSPLIALFFACERFSSDGDRFDQNRGFIYLLKNDLIDITDILSCHEDDNFLKRFIYDEDGIVLTLYEKFVDFEKRYPKTFYRYFKVLNDDWLYYLVDLAPRTPKRSRFPQYDDGEYKRKIELRYTPGPANIMCEIEKEQKLFASKFWNIP